jgi:hypothetical protein
VAEDSDVVVMFITGAGLIVMLSWRFAVCGVGFPESVATTVKLVAPAALGRPASVPEALKVSPAGNEEPEASFHVTGGVPPELPNVAL